MPDRDTSTRIRTFLFHCTCRHAGHLLVRVIAWETQSVIHMRDNASSPPLHGRERILFGTLSRV